jgi:hypothetical protein
MKLKVAIEVEVHDVEQLKKVARERMDAACVDDEIETVGQAWLEAPEQ